MKYQSILAALSVMLGLAVAVPQGRNRNKNNNNNNNDDEVLLASDFAGGRIVQPGATCSRVQGIIVCDDGFGNTL